jgi:hypothetical protein
MWAMVCCPLQQLLGRPPATGAAASGTWLGSVWVAADVQTSADARESSRALLLPFSSLLKPAASARVVLLINVNFESILSPLY